MMGTEVCISVNFLASQEGIAGNKERELAITCSMCQSKVMAGSLKQKLQFENYPLK
jgi:hypothetical protein